MTKSFYSVNIYIMKKISLSFVIPVYNEEKRLKKTFKALKEANIPSELIVKEVIFVNDGSRDDTKKIIEKNIQRLSSYTGAKVSLINVTLNRGKGHAVKVGMLEAKSDYTLFFDADMATPLSEMNKFVPYFLNKTEVIVGTRKNGHSTVVVRQPRHREILGQGFTYLTKILLNTWVTDFTCGFKAFSKSAKNKIFTQSLVSRWGYDAEILFLAKNLNLECKEVPVAWSDDRNSKVKVLRSIYTTLKDLLFIKKNQLTGVYKFGNSSKYTDKLQLLLSRVV